MNGQANKQTNRQTTQTNKPRKHTNKPTNKTRHVQTHEQSSKQESKYIHKNLTSMYIYALGSRAATPPPHPSRPPAPVPPGPRTAPAPSGPAQPERTHANQREGTMENEPHQSRDRGTVCKEKRAILYGNVHVTMTLLLTSGSNHTIHIFVEHTAPHRRGGANQNDHRPHRGDNARNDDITTNKRQQPYHTSVEHTAPPQAGRGQPKRPQAPLHRGGGRGDEAKQDQTGKATRPNTTTTHLTGKGGYHGVGGGVWQPCIIYCMYTCGCKKTEQNN